MHTHTLITLTRRGISALTAGFLATQAASGIDLVENFDGATLDEAVWEVNGAKSYTVADGSLTFNDGAGDWANGNIRSQQRFFIPEAGETSTFEWTLGAATTSTEAEGGQTVRMQIGIVSANQTGDNPEHYPNNTGGVWIDIDGFYNSDLATANGVLFYADDTKQANQNAFDAGTVTPIWNWKEETIVYRLEITDTQYEWYENDFLISSYNWTDIGIDTEFDNGFRISALGMNYNNGGGTTSFEKIEITNAQGPPGLLASFQADQTTVESNQTVTLSWIMDPEASGSINQEIGSIDAATTAGAGSVSVLIPEVTEATTVDYIITVTKGADTMSRTVSLNVTPAPPSSLDDFLDDFDESFLNGDDWEHLGARTYSIADSLITWNDDGGTWGHGEVASLQTYPIPQAGDTTTITWVLGSATVTTARTDNENQALRPMCGIASAFEDNTWSRQHWQNDTGGIWLDITTMSDARPDGVSGDLVYANDTKTQDSNGTVGSNFDVLWNWETEETSFSLVLSNTDFTWKNGDNELGTFAYADAGLDTEFSNGFKVMFSAINSDIGRGTISLNSVQVDNGGTAPADAALTISDIRYNADNSVTLTWNSQAGATYKIETSTDLDFWLEQVDGVDADGPTREFTLSPGAAAQFYRVQKE